MSGAYRQSRNIEASIKQFLEAELASGNWSNVNVTLEWNEARTINLPVICIRSGTTLHNPVDIGGHSTWREPVILIDIFATGDGQRLDLKDFIIQSIRGGCPYYLYEIENGSIKTKTKNGRIRISNIDDDPINFDIDKDVLDPHDRFRHLIALTVATGKVES